MTRPAVSDEAVKAAMLATITAIEGLVASLKALNDVLEAEINARRAQP